MLDSPEITWRRDPRPVGRGSRTGEPECEGVARMRLPEPYSGEPGRVDQRGPDDPAAPFRSIAAERGASVALVPENAVNRRRLRVSKDWTPSAAIR